MEVFLVLFIVLLAMAYAAWSILAALRGRSSSCACGQGATTCADTECASCPALSAADLKAPGAMTQHRLEKESQ